MSNEENFGLDVSPLRLAATQLHEMFVEFRKAGFSRYEALYLIARMMMGNPESE